MSAGERNDFEAIRDGLLHLDPETRHQVIASMRLLREMPRPVAVRVLADAAMKAQLHQYAMPLLQRHGVTV